MKSPVAHGGAREWRKSMDDLVPGPAHPQAFPSKYPLISGGLYALALPRCSSSSCCASAVAAGGAPSSSSTT